MRTVLCIRVRALFTSAFFASKLLQFERVVITSHYHYVNTALLNDTGVATLHDDAIRLEERLLNAIARSIKFAR